MDELDELRLAIAKAKGYKRHDESGLPNIMPDWPRDIAAAWELEESIPEAEHANYAQFLADVIEPDERLNVRWWDLIHATPAQRCRAWLAWRRNTSQEAQG